MYWETDLKDFNNSPNHVLMVDKYNRATSFLVNVSQSSIIKISAVKKK